MGGYAIEIHLNENDEQEATERAERAEEALAARDAFEEREPTAIDDGSYTHCLDCSAMFTPDIEGFGYEECIECGGWCETYE